MKWEEIKIERRMNPFELRVENNILPSGKKTPLCKLFLLFGYIERIITLEYFLSASTIGND